MASAVASCDPRRSDPAATAPPPTSPAPTPVWNLSGIVRDRDRNGLPAALVAIVSGPFSGRSTLSGQDGAFRFVGVSGPVAITASKTGYERYLQTFDITTDLTVDVPLVRAVPADSIQLGAVIESSVSAVAPPCDREQWDVAAPCQRFLFTAPASGSLSIAITWVEGPLLDATLVTLGNEYIATSRDIGPGRVELTGPVTAGQTYEVRVNAYYGAQVFTLRAELR